MDQEIEKIKKEYEEKMKQKKAKKKSKDDKDSKDIDEATKERDEKVCICSKPVLDNHSRDLQQRSSRCANSYRFKPLKLARTLLLPQMRALECIHFTGRTNMS
jgi:hypothetical protein